MKVLVAGATGALGKQLVPRLVASGHAIVNPDKLRHIGPVTDLRSYLAT
jgi:nucleoside-diphosphate-sugar epimerase